MLCSNRTDDPLDLAELGLQGAASVFLQPNLERAGLLQQNWLDYSATGPKAA